MIQLNDGKAWFRRWMWVGFLPITHEGWLLVTLAGGLCLAAFVTVWAVDGQSPWTEVAIGVALVTAITANAIAFFKTEDSV